jgi:hypothetical protein
LLEAMMLKNLTDQVHGWAALLPYWAIANLLLAGGAWAGIVASWILTRVLSRFAHTFGPDERLAPPDAQQAPQAHA